MQRIKNKNYRQFLDEGVINLLTKQQIDSALDNIKGRHDKEGRALLICLYLTGARPSEALEMKGKHIQKKDGYIQVRIEGKKGSSPRTLSLMWGYPLARELFDFSQTVFPELYLFPNFKGEYLRECVRKDGSTYTRVETSDRLRYHFKKWFKGVVDGGHVPYFLRHNRFSLWADQKIDMANLMQLKGAKSEASVAKYLHLSKLNAQKIARKTK